MPDCDANLYGWANEQTTLLRAGLLADADIANIAEEIESMGRSEKRDLVNHLAVLSAQRENGLGRATFPPTDPYGPVAAIDEGFHPE